MGRQFTWLERLTEGRWSSPVDVAQRVEIISEPVEGDADALFPFLMVDDVFLSLYDQGPLDLEQLERSLDEGGCFFIWTCECGAPSCGGMWKGVKVRHVGDVVEWRDLDQRRKFAFRKGALRQALESAVANLRRQLEERPALRLEPGQNRDFLKRRG
jgi:hypothetical protein